MWKSPDGRANTVALPDPTSAMTSEFVESLRGLEPHGRNVLSTMVEDAQEEFFDLLDDVAPTEPTSPDEDALPVDYLRGAFTTAEDIADYLKQIDPRWRLDALMAVEDYLDELDDSESMSWLGRLFSWIR